MYKQNKHYSYMYVQKTFLFDFCIYLGTAVFDSTTYCPRCIFLHCILIHNRRNCIEVYLPRLGCISQPDQATNINVLQALITWLEMILLIYQFVVQISNVYFTILFKNKYTICVYLFVFQSRPVNNKNVNFVYLFDVGLSVPSCMSLSSDNTFL